MALHVPEEARDIAGIIIQRQELFEYRSRHVQQ
jgi:hypothetical protein